MVDLSYDELVFKVDSKLFDLREGLECFNKDLIIWYCGILLSVVLIVFNFKGEFFFFDYLKLIKILSSVGL